VDIFYHFRSSRSFPTRRSSDLVLVSVVGIEKVVPTWSELDPLLRLLPRSSTGERMNPYTSTWTGVTPGDGPQEVHVVLLDNGRRSEEHTSELQSRFDLVCRLLR